MVFKLKNGQKDVRYYTHLAETVGSTAFLGEAVHQSTPLPPRRARARATSRRSPARSARSTA